MQRVRQRLRSSKLPATYVRAHERQWPQINPSPLIAATIGLTLVNAIQPGAGLPEDTRDELMARFSGGAEGMAASGPPDFGINTFVNIVPRNPVAAAADMDMLALIFFALILGAALTVIPDKRSDPVIRVLEGLGDAIIVIITWAMKLAPYGVFGLIFVITSQFGWGILAQLGMYVGVVLLGLLSIPAMLKQGYSKALATGTVSS